MSVHAWSDTPDEPDDPTEVFAPAGTTRSVTAVAVLAAIAAATAATAAVVVFLSPKPQPMASPYRIMPAPVEQAPPPAAPEPPAPKPPPPPIAAAPVKPPETPPFIAALNADGINISEPQGAIVNAHIACVNLGRGISKRVIVAEVKENTSNFTDSEAADFVDLSEAFYCPQYNR